MAHFVCLFLNRLEFIIYIISKNPSNAQNICYYLWKRGMVKGREWSKKRLRPTGLEVILLTCINKRMVHTTNWHMNYSLQELYNEPFHILEK